MTELLAHHIAAFGPTASGKSMRGVMQLLFQILDRGNSSIIMLDAKGSREAVHMLRARAALRGIPFYFFSLDPRVAGRLFSLFRDPAFRSLSPIEKYQVVAKAFGTQNREGYGKSHFSAMNRDPLAGIFELFLGVLSFREILELLSDPEVRRRLRISKRQYEAAAHLLSCLKEIGRVQQADPRLEDGIPPGYFAHAIQIEWAFNGPCVLYFYIPASVNQSVAQYLARLVIHTIDARARTIQTDHPHIYLVCEEASVYLESSLRIPLVQLRDRKVSFIFITQNIADFRLPDEDLRDVVTNSTHVKLFFGVHDKDGREYLARESGERRDTLGATSTSQTESPTGSSAGVGTQRREVVVPRIGSRELELVNTNDDLAVFEASPPTGYTRPRHPLLVRVPFPVSEAEYAAYKAEPWPEPIPGVTIRGEDISRPPPPPDSSLPVPTPPPTTPQPPSPPASPPTPTRKSRRRPPTPEQAAQAAEAAEYLKRLKDEE